MQHIKLNEFSDIETVRPSPQEIVILERETFPWLVEAADYIRNFDAFPYFAVWHPHFSKLKLNKNQLTTSDGLVMITKYNTGFISMFLTDPKSLRLTPDTYIIVGEDDRLDEIQKFLQRNGIEHNACTREEFEQMIVSHPNREVIDFKTMKVKSNFDGEIAKKKIVSKCVREIRMRGLGKEYAERLKKEIDILERCDLFGMFYDLYVATKGAKVLLRGSANNSLICYLLGIGKIDPIRFNLPFERFINVKKMYKWV